MPELDDVTQTFTADVADYIAKLELAKQAAKEFADEADEAGVKADFFGASARAAADMLEQMVQAETLLVGISSQLNSILRELSDAADTLSRSEELAAISAGIESAMLDQLAKAAADAAEQTLLLAGIEDALAGIALKMGVTLAQAVDTIKETGDETEKTTDKVRRAAGPWWTFGFTVGQAIHMAIMFPLELAATAIPALTALSLALLAMQPMAETVFDHFKNLITASGSLTQAIGNMSGPMSRLAGPMQAIQQASAPNVWIAMGAGIDIATSHLGAFQSVALQVSNMLGTFAVKLQQDLAGSAGKQITGLFSHMVTDAQQWGQVLGQFGHAFLNIMTAMPGLGEYLLTILDQVSKILVTLTGNPVIAFMMKWLFFMTGIYRYALLIQKIMEWTGATKLIQWVGGFFGGGAGAAAGEAAGAGAAGAAAAAGADVAAAGEGVAAGGLAAEAGMAAAADGAVTLGSIIPPLGIAMAVVAGGFLLWKISSHEAADGTQHLIQQVQAMPQTPLNISTGIDRMMGNLKVLNDTQLPQLTTQQNNAARAADTMGGSLDTAGRKGYGLAVHLAQIDTQVQNNTRDSGALISTIQTQLNKLKDQQTFFQSMGTNAATVGADVMALTFQTEIQDSHVQQLNQAWDQYFQLLSAGEGGLAGFSNALNNMLNIPATGGPNLSNATTLNPALTAAQQAQTQAAAASAQAAIQAAQAGLAQAQAQLAQAQGTGDPLQVQIAQAGVAQAQAQLQQAQADAQQQAAQAQQTAQQAATGTTQTGTTLQQFVAMIQSGSIKGSAAWSNFTQVMSQQLPQLADWFRTAKAAGVMNSKDFQKAILDMAGSMMKFAGNSPAAQAMILGFIQQVGRLPDGVVVKTWQQLKDEVKKYGAGLPDLQSKTDHVTIAMSNLSTMTQNMNKQLQNMEVNAIAAAALAMSGFNQDVQNMIKAEKTHRDVGGLSWQQWAAKAQQAQKDAMKYANNTANQILGIKSAEDLLYDKTVHIGYTITNLGPVSSHTFSGHTLGFHGGVVGYQSGGMVGGPGGADRVPVMATFGEGILTAAAVSALGGPMAIRALNSSPQAGVASIGGGLGGGGGGMMSLNLHVDSYINSTKIASEYRTTTLIYNRRNPQNNLALRVR